MAGDYLHYLTQSLYNASLKYTFTVIKSPRVKGVGRTRENPRYKNESGMGERKIERKRIGRIIATRGISARGHLDDRAGGLRKNKTSVQQIIF